MFEIQAVAYVEGLHEKILFAASEGVPLSRPEDLRMS